MNKIFDLLIVFLGTLVLMSFYFLNGGPLIMGDSMLYIEQSYTLQGSYYFHYYYALLFASSLEILNSFGTIIFFQNFLLTIFIYLHFKLFIKAWKPRIIYFFICMFVLLLTPLPWISNGILTDSLVTISFLALASFIAFYEKFTILTKASIVVLLLFILPIHIASKTTIVLFLILYLLYQVFTLGELKKTFSRYLIIVSTVLVSFYIILPAYSSVFEITEKHPNKKYWNMLLQVNKNQYLHLLLNDYCSEEFYTICDSLAPKKPRKNFAPYLKKFFSKFRQNVKNEALDKELLELKSLFMKSLSDKKYIRKHIETAFKSCLAGFSNHRIITVSKNYNWNSHGYINHLNSVIKKLGLPKLRTKQVKNEFITPQNVLYRFLLSLSLVLLIFAILFKIKLPSTFWLIISIGIINLSICFIFANANNIRYAMRYNWLPIFYCILILPSLTNSLWQKIGKNIKV